MAFTIIKGGVNYKQRFAFHLNEDPSWPKGPFLNATIVSKLLTQGSLQEWLFGSSLFSTFFCNSRERHSSFFQGIRFEYQVLYTSEHRVHIVNFYRTQQVTQEKYNKKEGPEEPETTEYTNP